MAAMALLLNVRLHKPGVYVLNAEGRAPQVADTAGALVLASQALVVFVLFALITLIFIPIRGGV
jgi:adenosylcobinamide-phosphate synthase